MDHESKLPRAIDLLEGRLTKLAQFAARPQSLPGGDGPGEPDITTIELAVYFGENERPFRLKPNTDFG